MDINQINGCIFSNKIQNLNAGLKFFGLNPRDWQVKERSDGLLMIHHLRDPELMMQGQAYSKGQSWDWREISIAAV